MALKVVIPQDITEAGKNYLKERGYEVVIGTGSNDIEVLKKEVAGADGLLVRTAPYPAEVLAAAKNVKVVGRHGVGVNNIDLKYCREHGIVVTFAPESNGISVAEHTIGMMVAAAHNFARFDKGVREGEWGFRNTYKGLDLQGKTLGLIGTGRIGQKVAHMASAAFGMKVIGYDAYVPADKFPEGIEFRADIDDVFREADFISLHVPATKETTDLICKRTLGLMKKTAIVINCARGEVVDLDALFEALRDGVIFGAALDVFKEEPPEKHPIFGMANVLVTPHSAALTAEAMDRMGLHAAMGIDSVLSGKAPKWPVKL